MLHTDKYRTPINLVTNVTLLPSVVYKENENVAAANFNRQHIQNCSSARETGLIKQKHYQNYTVFRKKHPL